MFAAAKILVARFNRCVTVLLVLFMFGCSTTLRKDVALFQEEFNVKYPVDLTVDEEQWFSDKGIQTQEDFQRLALEEKVKYLVISSVWKERRDNDSESYYQPDVETERSVLSQNVGSILARFIGAADYSTAFRLESVGLAGIHFALRIKKEKDIQTDIEVLHSLADYSVDPHVSQRFRLPVVGVFDILSSRGGERTRQELEYILGYVRYRLDEAKFLDFEIAGTLATLGDKKSLIFVVSNLNRLQTLEQRLEHLDESAYPFTERALDLFRNVIPGLPEKNEVALEWLLVNASKLTWDDRNRNWHLP